MRLHALRPSGAPRPTSRGLRVFALAFALLQIGLQGAFAVGDGLAARDGASVAIVHAESPWHTHHRAHDDDCAICHVLATSSDVPPRAPGLPPHAAGPATLPATERVVDPHAVAPGARLARAPPQSV